MDIGEKKVKTRVTKLLNIKHPVIQGGMAWVADEHLASAVRSRRWALLQAGAPKDVICQKIRAVKMTDKPLA